MSACCAPSPPRLPRPDHPTIALPMRTFDLKKDRHIAADHF
jgi:hypothetical protein